VYKFTGCWIAQGRKVATNNVVHMVTPMAELPLANTKADIKESMHYYCTG
jgi:hypothetical protein